MKVLKFGGASVKDAEAVQNVAQILESYKEEELLVIISAMGKTTNALEEIINLYYEGSNELWDQARALKEYHTNIIEVLFNTRETSIMDEIENLFFDLEFHLEQPHQENYARLYDEIVSYGELFSTKIISAYLTFKGFKNKWLDSRNFIITDGLHRFASVHWAPTTKLIQTKTKPLVDQMPVITQGFIGRSAEKATTTLGREGSDYSAAVYAHALDAEKVLIWKDVPGVLNADPQKFQDTVKFKTLPYEEAIEMTYYGAKVLHAKTIKPLQNKQIQLEVKSFLNPDEPGTTIKSNVPKAIDNPIFIHKEAQCLIALATRDYSFIEEQNLSKIFKSLAHLGIRVNLMSSSAIRFSICVDDDPVRLEELQNVLKEDFKIETDKNLELLTIRHYQDGIVKKLTKGKQVLIENTNQETVQFVLKSNSYDV